MHTIWLIFLLKSFFEVNSETNESLSFMFLNSSLCQNETCFGDNFNYNESYDNELKFSEPGKNLNESVIISKSKENFLNSTQSFDHLPEFQVPTENGAEKNNASKLEIDYYVNDTELSMSFSNTETTMFQDVYNNSQNPFYNSSSSTDFSFFKVIQNEDICFCDIYANQCDINCCCDPDCSDKHWGIFTKCLNENHLDNNLLKCFKKTSFFTNNTKLQTIKTENSLLCILKNNIKFNKSVNIYRFGKCFLHWENF